MHIKSSFAQTWTDSLWFLGLLIARHPQGLGLSLGCLLFFFFFNFYLFIYFLFIYPWLCCVFIAARGLLQLQ